MTKVSTYVCLGRLKNDFSDSNCKIKGNTKTVFEMNSIISQTPFGFSHVKLHRAAVSSISGKSYSFRALPSNPGGVGLQGEVHEDETGRNIVKTVKLDDLFQDEADIIFMKVDTEGHEFEVLKSAERLLKEHKIRNIVVEIRSQQAEMVEYMYANGYTCDLTKSAWRSKAKLSCKNSMEKVISEIQRIPKGHFDDMFCCVT